MCPPSPGAKSFSFNDGSGKSMPSTDPNGGFPPKDWAKPILYNVDRVKPVHGDTADMNGKYQKALGGVWQFYKLIVTQWPLQLSPPKPIPPEQSGAPKFTSPGLKATTSFANTVLETFEQQSVSTGCMACHETVHVQTDFVWGLEVRAFEPTPPSPSPSRTISVFRSAAPKIYKLSPALEQLRKILSEADEAQRTGKKQAP